MGADGVCTDRLEDGGAGRGVRWVGGAVLAGPGQMGTESDGGALGSL